MLHFVLCDDNEVFLSKTSNILQNIFMKYDINAKVSYFTSDPIDLLNYMSNNIVDVLILDIDLNSTMSGIDLANKIRECNKAIYIIFITGHFEYSMLAYKVKTFDYLVKPISLEKMEDTILRLYYDACENTNSFLNINNGKYLIRQNDISYIEKFKSKAIIHTDSSDIEVYGSFNNLQSCLSDNFIRCHKSYIVNSSKVTKIDSKNNLLYIDDTKLTYSRNFLNPERGILSDGKNIN